MNPTDEELLLSARALPRSVEPARDLWPEISAELDPAATGSRTGRRLRSSAVWRRTAGLPLAAGLLLAVGLGFWLGLSQLSAPGGDPSVTLATHALPEAATPVNLTVDPELHRLRVEMAAQIYDRMSALPPETRRVILANLTLIDSALNEIDNSLADVGDSGLDRQLLMAMYADQISMMGTMNNLLSGVSPGTTRETTL